MREAIARGLSKFGSRVTVSRDAEASVGRARSTPRGTSITWGRGVEGRRFEILNCYAQAQFAVVHADGFSCRGRAGRRAGTRTAAARSAQRRSGGGGARTVFV